MCDLLLVFNDANKTGLAFKPVTVMTPIEVCVTIAESYMQEHENIREEFAKRTTAGYTSGSWNAKL